MNNSKTIRVYKENKFIGFYAGKDESGNLLCIADFSKAHLYNDEEERQEEKFGLLNDFSDYTFI